MRQDEILKSALQALQQLELTAEPDAKPRPLARNASPRTRLRIAKGHAHLDFDAEVHRVVTPQTVGPILSQLRTHGVAAKREPLLVATYLTTPVAETLRKHRQSFIDTAGNAYLEGPGLLVWVTGRKPTKTDRPPKTDRAYTNAGLRLLFALICDPVLAGAPQRKIAEAADVALGTVPPVLADMEEHGRLAVAGRKRRLIETKRLLDDWAIGYARTLRPKTLIRRFAAPSIQGWENWRLAEIEGRWGGEPAANRLVGYLTPGTLTIYAAKTPAKLIVEQRLQAVDSDDPKGQVEIRAPFWGRALQQTEIREDVVATALVYADLLATGDARCIETAALIYEHHLARRFPK